MKPEEGILDAYKELHPTAELQLADLKNTYISPKERKFFEMFFGKECVNQVFGEPTHLTKAEILLFEIQEAKICEADKFQNLIDIAKNLDIYIERKVPKFRNLFATGIPITLLQKESKVLQIHFFELESSIAFISIQELEKMRDWISSPEAELESNIDRKVNLNYIFESVYTSLNIIVKNIRSKA